MKKILIIGMPGSGKSTLSLKLGKILKLPVIHLDNYFHKSRNETLAEHEWDKSVSDLVKQKEWIMDGFYPRTLDIRLKEADTIIFLDIPKWVTIPRLILAGIKGLRKGRPGQPEFLKNKLSGPLFSKVLSFSRKELLSKLDKYKGKKLVILRNSKEIDEFLKSLY